MNEGKLGSRSPALLDQPHSLELELSRKLRSLHDTPPGPSKHLTRCLRNLCRLLNDCFGCELRAAQSGVSVTAKLVGAGTCLDSISCNVRTKKRALATAC